MDTQKHGPPTNQYWAWVPKSILHPKQTSIVDTKQIAHQRQFKQRKPRANNTQGFPNNQHQKKKKWLPKVKIEVTKTKMKKKVWHSKINHQAATTVTFQAHNSHNLCKHQQLQISIKVNQMG